MNLVGNGKCAKNWNLRDRGTGAQQFRVLVGLVMSEIHRPCPRRYKFEFSFVGNDRRPSQKSGTRRENRNAPDSPDLSPSIPDDRGYLRFRVFIIRQNMKQSGNSKIPARLGFFRNMKTMSASQQGITWGKQTVEHKAFPCFRDERNAEYCNVETNVEWGLLIQVGSRFIFQKICVKAGHVFKQSSAKVQR